MLELPLHKMIANIRNLTFLEALRDFKEIYCDENRLIAEALRTTLKRRLLEPILDVGAGLGDIAEFAFPERRAVLLDINEIPDTHSRLHKRVTSDFFEYEPDWADRPRTMILCHVLQYLDNDITRLQMKISDLKPDVIIEVRNDNDGLFGNVMFWSLKHIVRANPEVECNFTNGQYKLAETAPIRATLKCPNYSIMARHFVEVLIDSPADPNSISKVERKLRALLYEPSIPINQTIYCYERKQ
jgi:hypothetical protein